jgi:hypothetical protein
MGVNRFRRACPRQRQEKTIPSQQMQLSWWVAFVPHFTHPTKLMFVPVAAKNAFIPNSEFSKTPAANAGRLAKIDHCTYPNQSPGWWALIRSIAGVATNDGTVQ